MFRRLKKPQENPIPTETVSTDTISDGWDFVKPPQDDGNALIPSTTPSEGWDFVKPPQDDGYVLIPSTTSTPAVNLVIEESNEQKIQREYRIGLRIMSSTAQQQFLRYSIVVPLSLRPLMPYTMRNDITDVIKNWLDTVALEFTVLNQRSPMTLETLNYRILLDVTNFINSKLHFFLESVNPAIKDFKFTNTQRLLNYLILSADDSRPVRILWERVWQDVVMRKSIKHYITENIAEKLLEHMKAIVKTNYFADQPAAAKELQRFAKQTLGLSTKKWKLLQTRPPFYNLPVLLLFKQQNHLEATMLPLTRRNYSTLTAAEKQEYHQGMQRIMDHLANKKSYKPKLLVSMMAYQPSLIAFSWVHSTYSLINSSLRNADLSQELYYPTLILMMQFVLRVFAKTATIMEDLEYCDSVFMVQRYKENLVLEGLHSRLPTWVPLQQTQEYSIPNANLGANFFKRSINNVNKYYEFIELQHKYFSVLTMMGGLIVQAAIEEMNKHITVGDSTADTVLHVSLLLINWVAVIKALNYARNLDNSLRHSEERYRGRVNIKETVVAIGEKSESFYNTATTISLWHKAKPAAVAKQPSPRIEVIEDSKKEGIRKRM